MLYPHRLLIDAADTIFGRRTRHALRGALRGAPDPISIEDAQALLEAFTGQPTPDPPPPDPTETRRAVLARETAPADGHMLVRNGDAYENRTPAQVAALLPVESPIVSVTAFGAVGDGTTDNSAAIQAAINAAHDAGGGSVFIPEGIYRANVVLRPNVHIVGTGWKSILKSVAGASSPVIGSPLNAYAANVYDELYHCGVSMLRIDGDARSNSTGRGIDLINSAADAFWSISGHFDPDSWNDPAPIIDRVFVFDTGGDGIRLGKNMRGAAIANSFVFRSRRTGLVVDATDVRCTGVQIGACADGVLVTRSNNGFANCKAWWSVGNAADPGTDYVGAGDGWRIIGPTGKTQLTGCESQDNFGAGLVIGNTESVVATGFVCGGDTYAGLSMWGAVTRCSIDLTGVWADRTQLDKLVRINGAGVTGNVITARDHPTRSRNAGFKALTLENGALAYLNVLAGEAFNGLEAEPAANNPTHRPAGVNGWVTYPGLHGLGYRRVAPDKVRVSGAVRNGTNDVITGLPAVLRPAANRYSPGALKAAVDFTGWTTLGVVVAGAGDVSVIGGAGAAFLAFDFEFAL